MVKEEFKMADDTYSEIERPTCSECGEQCTAVEEGFDYGGSHCTHGKGGTHHTGLYVSDCCSADCED